MGKLLISLFPPPPLLPSSSSSFSDRVLVLLGHYFLDYENEEIWLKSTPSSRFMKRD